ncbi:ABC transporter ATP-binding protein/permease [Tissierella carlieri]|uniref:ABC transporter ATP-binding protein n=1 Tax=Tissierella carlieri TaxID=689904 RepID=UPI001C0F68B2|nr:ABC transporter ATP-binding protein [Tissierella carlieri]MBU5311246.1 ABC transporter ATP-binding protein/permease [Tissierella carlieri]MDU5081666.1 ABC transporter ATP-binding protein [Bacillota bacterium]
MSERNVKNQRRGGPMGHGPMGGMGGRFEKPKDFKGTFSKLLNYLRPYKLKLIIVMIFAIGSTAFSIVGPKILGKATTEIFEGIISKISGVEGGGIDFQYILNIILLLIGLYIISALFSFIQGLIVTGVAQKVSYNLRKEISEKVNRLPLKYFDGVSHGDVLSRVTNDVDTVSQSLNQSMSNIITSATTLVGILIMMLSISWQMTIAAVLILPISMILVMTVVKKSQKYFRAQQKSLGQVNGHIEEVYGGHNIMKAFNAEDEVIEEFSKINGELYNSAWKAQFLSGMMMPIMTFIGNIGYVAVSILGGWYAIRKTIEVGDILSFIQYIRSFTQPIAQVAQISNVLQSTVAAAERVFEFLGEDEEIKESEVPVKLEEVEGSVTFENVKFGYNEDKIIINNFSADIKPGQKVAIVGPTGAGKTTIVKLLMRFYDLNEGRILIDGYDINDFTREDLRDNFGMVLQDTWLFSGSIMDNIRYGRLDATEDEVIRASKSAYAHRFIQTLPDGYNMVINEEANNISQGQKQLLTIARAILSDPKILILDEATSSVDTRTEVLIQKAMENLMKGRTSFIIAHRLSTIRDADLILVMKDGDIVEQGSHEELLQKSGFYAELYNSQFAA